MNAQRRKDIDKALAMVAEAASILRACADDERDYYDNMPENLQSAKRGENADADADKLSEWADTLEEMDASEFDH